MKKVFTIVLFVLGAFTSSQAQIIYEITNTSSLSWSFSFSDGSTVTVNSSPNTSQIGILYDFLELPVDWWIKRSGCFEDGTFTGVGGPVTVPVACTPNCNVIYTITALAPNPDGYDYYIDIAIQ